MKELKEQIIEAVQDATDTVDGTVSIPILDHFLDGILTEQCNIGVVSGMLPLTENAKKKLEYINGSCISRNFPKEQPTKEWAGAVLDLLEELGLGNYR